MKFSFAYRLAARPLLVGLIQISINWCFYDDCAMFWKEIEENPEKDIDLCRVLGCFVLMENIFDSWSIIE